MFIAALITAAVAFAPADDKKPDKDTLEVRKLDAGLLKGVKLDVGAKAGVTTLSSEEDAAKLLGKDAAQNLAKEVDFTKEEVAFVSFQTGGPPFGQLKYEADAKEKKVEFYVDEPKGGGARGRALKLGRELFAVPKGTKTTFGGAK